MTMVKTKASLAGRTPVKVSIQTEMCLCDVLRIERVLDECLRHITDEYYLRFLSGMEHALELLDMKPERRMADDREEHYFIPKLHSLIEDTGTSFRVLRMGDSL